MLGKVCARFNWVVQAYCQMSNHYHLLVETLDGNLSRGMSQLNGQFTQRFNRRHGVVGHLFQGRYKAILVQKGSYLLELARYVVLNPVRAGMVGRPEDWRWSSYPAAAGLAERPDWLDVNRLLGPFGKHRKTAIERYRAFVMAGKGESGPLENVRYQLLLGDDAFVEAHHQDGQAEGFREISRAQRKLLVLPLSEYQQKYAERNEAMARAYLSGGYTMAEIGEHFGVHYMTVSRAVRRFEETGG